MRRLELITIGMLLAAGVLFWFFPLFHVVAVGQAGAGANRSDEFDAEKFVQGFWTERLTPAFDQAADAATVLGGLRKDPGARLDGNLDDRPGWDGPRCFLCGAAARLRRSTIAGLA